VAGLVVTNESLAKQTFADRSREAFMTTSSSMSSHHGAGAALDPRLRRPPALHVSHGSLEVPDNLDTEWYELAVPSAQARIRANLAGVGRIQRESLILGTGFLVARNIVLTARHVAESFTNNIDGVAKIRFQWEPLVDFDGETAPHGHEDGPAAAHADHTHDDDHAMCGCGQVQSVIFMHETLDLALLRITFTGTPANWRRPQPMTLTSDVPAAMKGGDAQPKVYLIGFPRSDGTALPSELAEVFGPNLGVKRLQPGHITDAPTAGREFQHDASTLKGNSGSCVVDLQTHRVIGVHVQGSRERQGEQAFNRAIAFWLLSEEDKAPLRRAGVDLI
jgi:hypothetical protein